MTRFVPNLITLARIFFSIAFAVCAAWGPLTGTRLVVLLALLVFIDVSDALDGFAARRLGASSVLGGIFDPMSDSLSRLTVYFSLAINGYVSLAVPLVMTTRDLVVAYTRVVSALTGMQTGARVSGKIKAVVQAVGAPAILLFTFFVYGYRREVFVWITASIVMCMTVISALDYIVGSRQGIRKLL
jgi:CDP-diacylglycerol--glycerol-3-phosphate 3-phosphatidyltransferase